MNILMINKFLYPHGGSESYMFSLGNFLTEQGHTVKYWGMSDPRNIIDDEYDSFVSNIDYSGNHGINGKAASFSRTLYSIESAKKIVKVLDGFRPDIVHIHNYNFQITPSILPVIKKRNIRIVQTAHDSQMVCPFHRLYIYHRKMVCSRCVHGSFLNCIKMKCFDNSLLKSILGTLESYLYHGLNFYNRYIDHIISPSHFLASLLRHRITAPISVIPNFVDIHVPDPSDKQNYILYVGRISYEKGIVDFANLIKNSQITLYIVGDGPAAIDIFPSHNVKFLGKKSGEELWELYRHALFIVQPSNGYENCPMTVLESFACGTPVIASNHSGFLELIRDGVTGYLYDNFAEKTITNIEELCRSYDKQLSANCLQEYSSRFSPAVHLELMKKVYEGECNEGV